MPYDLATYADLVDLAAHARLSWQHWFARARATRLGLSDDRYGGAYALAGAANLAPPPRRVEGADPRDRGGGLMAPASRSWIVLGQDGRLVTLGRAAPPTDDEIAAASVALAEQGLGGWIVTMDGSYWGRGSVTLASAQTIGANVPLDWTAAVTGFLGARQRARR
jgi:hypothetical protein